MDFNKIMKIYTMIKERLPDTYPKPKLVFFEDEDSMINNSNLEIDDDEIVYAIYCPNNNLISICNNLFELTNIDIAKILLHEIGHARANIKYGYKSKHYTDELECDRFALRWIKKIKIKSDNDRFMGWTNREVNYLKKHYSKTKKQNILLNINKTWKAIQSKARRLNLKRE